MALDTLEEVTETRTTTTTRTTTWERGRAPAWLWLLPLLLLLGLLLWGLTSQRTSIEDDLAERARAAIAADGVAVVGVDVEVRGRDLLLTGTVPSGTDLDAVLATVAEVEGVRVVEADLALAAAPVVDDGGSDEPEAPLTAPAAIVLTGDNDQLVVSGVVASETDRAALLDQLVGALGSDVELVDQLQVDAVRGGLGEAEVLLEGGLVGADLPAAVDGAVALAVPDGTVTGSIAVWDPPATVGESESEAAEEPVDEPDQDIIDAGFGAGSQDDPWVTTFASNSSDVVDETGSVAEAREVLPTLPAGSVVRVIGHTDTVGSPEDNRILGLARAEAVAAQLREVAPDLEYVLESKGEDEPEGAFDTSRRVDFFYEP